MYRYLLLSILMLAGFQNSFTRHIIGGEATYVCVETDGVIGGKAKFDLTFIIYRDKLGGGADYDRPGSFGIYRQTGPGLWETVDTLTTFPGLIRDIELTYDPCVIPPDNVAAEKGEYHFSVELEISTATYMIAYQRCCRNNTINNIITPESTGAAYQVEISSVSQLTGNSSPYFKDFPPLVICAGIDFSFDHSAIDAEGDSLVYSYVNSLQAGGLRGSSNDYPGSPFACNGVTPSAWRCRPPYPKVQFASPYSWDIPLGGAPIVSINRFTGVIKGVPTVLGQYVVGVEVKEYRDGQLIGSVLRDFQFNVIPCDPKVFAEIEYDQLLGYKKYVINSCGQDTVEFKNLSQDANYIFNTLWVFDIDGRKDSLTTWDATKVFPGIGNYYGKLILNHGTPCKDSAHIYLNVYPDITADFDFAYDTCKAGPVQFTDQSYSGTGEIDKWIWDLEEQYRSFKENPSYVYQSPGDKVVNLMVEDRNECRDTIQKEVPYFPAPAIIVVEPSQFTGCSPALLKFKNLSVPIDSTYTTTWSFGDGSTSSDLHPTHRFDEPGLYSIDIEVISPIGCRVVRSFPNWIRIKEGPVADFYYTPDNPSILNNTIEFTDESIDAVNWLWNFGDGQADFSQFPVHTFQDTGIHKVQLVVTHENHCLDTMIQYIDIEPLITYFMPNAFSPNGDGTNEVFKGTGLFVEGLKAFSLRIWSRWGSMVFESEDPEIGWNGRKNNVGELLPKGVYVYQLEYVDARGKDFKERGFATLIR